MSEIMKFAALILALLIEGGLVYVFSRWVKDKIGDRKYKEIIAWVEAAVAAAEILFPGSKTGMDKKAYVLDFLSRKDIDIDAESLDVLIEAAVEKLHSVVWGKADGQDASAGG